MPPHEPAARHLVALVLLALAAVPAAAQERPRHHPPDEPEAEEWRLPDDPANAVEFAISADGLWFGYRSGLHRGNGFVSLGLFAGEDDDYALAARLMRFGEPAGESPLGFGIGLGAFGATTDASDSELLAITLTGAADLALHECFVLDYPMRVGVELSYAPDQSTFVDGTRVLDVLGAFEIDLSTWATAYAGYRHLEVDIEGDEDVELDSSLQAGVRLGF